jgi:hypothetical protein
MDRGPNSLAVQPELITNFIDGLEAIKSYQVYPMIDLSGEVNHNGRYSRPNIKLGAGLFIDKEALAVDSGGPTPGSKPAAFSFQVQPGHRLGREASHNQVFFGKLLVHGMYANGMATETQIAIKPTKNREALLGELAMEQHLCSLDIPTFAPRGFLTTAASATNQDYLLTRFEKRVATMDTVEWRALDDHEKWEQLDFAVATLSLLHSYMLFHGDLEFKNVAFGETGDLIIVDPELMVSTLAIGEAALQSNRDEVGQRLLESIKRCMASDFTSVCNSIDQFIFHTMPQSERPTTEETKFRLYNRYLFKPYKEDLLKLGSEYLPVLLQAYDIMLRERKQRIRETTPSA